MEKNIAVGVDIGGTFTDVWVIDLLSEEVWKGKVATTPTNYSKCFLNAIEKASKLANVQLKDINFIVHGSTVATNTVVTRQGAKIALLTTQGFRDVLQIGTTKRDDIYDLFYKKTIPLVPRQNRYEIRERINWKGEEIVSIDEMQLRSVLKGIPSDTENICICYLHSYVNAENEKKTEEIIHKETPNMSVSSSHRVSPVYREYERLSTTVLNGYVMPKTSFYLNSLKKTLDSKGLPTEPLLITGDGGTTVLEDVLEKPAMTFLSGPASGVAGAAFLGGLLGYKNIISFDMGGTSCDVSLIYQGEINIRTETSIAGYPSNLPMVDIHTIGAGGGSVAWVDSGGVPHVGPHSSGSEPGPACYAQGGQNPTVTDANLFLGRYNPEFFLGGEKKLDLDLARSVIHEKLAIPLGLSDENSAIGILKIVNSNMVDAVKLLSIKNGYEPSEFVLMAMGGTACSHLPFLMDDLNINEVICPWMASVFCAFGALSLPIKHNFATTRKITDIYGSFNEIIQIFNNLESRGIERIKKDHIHFENVEMKRFIDARYAGQKHETTIPIDYEEIKNRDVQSIVDKFHRIHKLKYTYSHPGKKIELITFRLIAVGTIRNYKLAKLELPKKELNELLKGTRDVFFNKEWIKSPIYNGEQLSTGNKIEGPAVIERIDTTIIIPDGKIGIADEYGNLIIKRLPNA